VEGWNLQSEVILDWSLICDPSFPIDAYFRYVAFRFLSTKLSIITTPDFSPLPYAVRFCVAVVRFLSRSLSRNRFCLSGLQHDIFMCSLPLLHTAGCWSFKLFRKEYDILEEWHCNCNACLERLDQVFEYRSSSTVFLALQISPTLTGLLIGSRDRFGLWYERICN